MEELWLFISPPISSSQEGRKEGNVALILCSVVVGFGFWFLVTVV
jgi:hypothetical protein